MGAGLCVAMACDIVIVAQEAKVGLNFVRLGLHPGMASSWLLPRHVGPQQAAEWLYTGRIITGDEAAVAGLAARAVPAEQVLPTAVELASEIAEAAPSAVRKLKKLLRQSPTTTLVEELRLEAAPQAADYITADLSEGLAAARVRRLPEFNGRRPVLFVAGGPRG